MTETQPVLPRAVTQIQANGKDIYLIGTAHISAQSVVDVRETIQAVQPDAVCVELCPARYETLSNPDKWRQMDIVQVIKQDKVMLLLSTLIMTAFQRKLGEKLGVMPGAEMAEGIRQADAIKAQLVLADRDIQTTLKRTWGGLGLWAKAKMMTQLLSGLFIAEEIDAKAVEELKEAEALKNALDAIGEAFPEVKEIVLHERDTYLAEKIRQAPGQKIVAVLGAAHVPGVSQKLNDAHELAPLETLPKPGLSAQIMKWAIPASIILLFVYGFFKGDPGQWLETLSMWALITGVLSAIGAAAAFGHPLSILSAFVAAPFTTLHPLIAVGWVSGLVQAWVKKPTVGDLERLPEDIMTFKGFWLNPVSRILLVAALSNVGGTIGTFVAGSWIATKVLG